ncbi:MAG: LiaF transmembrane domain-containing protein [Candidatus Limimorpha sp.]
MESNCSFKNKFFMGITLIIIGVICLLNISDIIDFKGWWTLFIIIPSLCGLFFNKNKINSVLGIVIGALLLLSVYKVIPWRELWQYLLALMAIVAGVSILLFNRRKGCCPDSDVKIGECEDVVRDGRNIKVFNVTFGERDISFKGEVFDGAEVKTSFAGVNIDLRGAIINDGAVLSVVCSFAGVDVSLPDDVYADVVSNSAFGGVENRHNRRVTGTSKKIFIKANCSFGGIDIK